MRHDRGYVLCYLVATTVLFLWPSSATGGVKEVMKLCDPANLDKIPCGKNERCVQEKANVAQCLCKRGFELQYDQCVLVASSTAAPISANTDGSDEKSESGGGSVAAGLLIPTFLIVIGVLLYFGARRYKWLQRFRQFRQNRYGNVLVTRDDDEDDDPPIA